MKSTKNIFAVIIIIASIMLLITSLYLLLKNKFEDKQNNEFVEQLIEDVITTEEEQTETTLENTLSIDWNKLKQINEDIIAWIKIEDTNINYPILKDKELYYLKHSYNKQWNSNGSIFIKNKNPFEEKITTIYGHNMRNGKMFSELVNYLDKDFFNTHKNIKIYTQDKNYNASVFGCYFIEERAEEDNIKNLSFNEEMQYYKDKSNLSLKDFDSINKIIKLSTCSYFNNKKIPTEQRCYVIAKIEEI